MHGRNFQRRHQAAKAARPTPPPGLPQLTPRPRLMADAVASDPSLDELLGDVFAELGQDRRYGAQWAAAAKTLWITSVPVLRRIATASTPEAGEQWNKFCALLTDPLNVPAEAQPTVMSELMARLGTQQPPVYTTPVPRPPVSKSADGSADGGSSSAGSKRSVTEALLSDRRVALPYAKFTKEELVNDVSGYRKFCNREHPQVFCTLGWSFGAESKGPRQKEVDYRWNVSEKGPAEALKAVTKQGGLEKLVHHFFEKPAGPAATGWVAPKPGSVESQTSAQKLLDNVQDAKQRAQQQLDSIAERRAAAEVPRRLKSFDLKPKVDLKQKPLDHWLVRSCILELCTASDHPIHVASPAMYVAGAGEVRSSVQHGGRTRPGR